MSDDRQMSQEEIDEYQKKLSEMEDSFNNVEVIPEEDITEESEK